MAENRDHDDSWHWVVVGFLAFLGLMTIAWAAMIWI
jgi:hypothetical protein